MVTTVLGTDRSARHRVLLARAVAACRSRESWTAFSDNPADHPGGASARLAGSTWLDGHLARSFEMDHPGQWRVQTDEQSTYTGCELGIAYPAGGVDELIAGALTAWPARRDAWFEERDDVGLEVRERVASTASWSRAFGSTQVGVDKRYRLMPLGVGVGISCASFPAWNAYPAVLAGLVTGNPMILKPHPTSVLQMALAVPVQSRRPAVPSSVDQREDRS